jgi:hypothetical protein
MKLIWQIGVICVLFFIAINPLSNRELHYICRVMEYKFEDGKNINTGNLEIIGLKINSFRNIFTEFSEGYYINIRNIGEINISVPLYSSEDSNEIEIYDNNESFLRIDFKNYDDSTTMISIDKISETMLIFSSRAEWADRSIYGACREKD